MQPLFRGAICLEDGIRLAFDIGKLTNEKTKPANMLAIMGSKSIITDFSDIFHNCWLTAENFQDNFVVSGVPHAIKDLHEILKKKNIMSQILPVNYGFHTELIDPIEEDFKKLVKNIHISPTRIPMISSLTEGVVQELDGDYLWKAIRYPVNFEQTVKKIEQTGNYIFIDIGPSGTLSTFIKYILSPNSSSVSLQMINQFGRDLNAIEKLKTCLC
ncbi:acyltransferase domain-containing protein [bacterium]|nr:acyltransferase domain-containing protein [bacterium]